jgi:Ca2+-binding RTX toxin-like protein
VIRGDEGKIAYAGNDILYGESGKDTLVGELSADWLGGGDGMIRS